MPSTYLKINLPLRQAGSRPNDVQMPCMRSIQVVPAATPSVGSKRQSRVFGHRPCVKTRWTQSPTKDTSGSQLTVAHRMRYRHVCATIIAPDVQTKRSVTEKLAWVQTTNMVNFAALQLFIANCKCIGANTCRQCCHTCAGSADLGRGVRHEYLPVSCSAPAPGTGMERRRRL